MTNKKDIETLILKIVFEHTKPLRARNSLKMIPSKTAAESVEIEGLTSLVSSMVESKIPTRWERKQQEQSMHMGTPSRKRNGGVECAMSPARSPNVHNKENQSVNRPNTMSQAGSKKLSIQNQQSTRSLAGTPSGTDRFIPARSAVDFENASFAARSHIVFDGEDTTGGNSSTQDFNRVLQANMNADANSRILHYKARAPPSSGPFENPVSVLYSQQARKAHVSQLPSTLPTRSIPNAPTKVLDAPGIIDNFYVNPLDWSCSNFLGVGLGTIVYLWNASTGDIKELMHMDTDDEAEHISSLSFMTEGGGLVAIGSTDKTIGIWDIESGRRVRSMEGHESRVNALAWNKHILTSGGRDQAIFYHDVRVRNHIVASLKEGHEMEVCSLKWNEDGSSLASGGNDHQVLIWDARTGSDRPRLKLNKHTAAVKALAWCPYQRNVLATGGGMSDRTIKTWETVNGACTQSTDTGSQVCSLVFNPHEKELLSSHGFANCELTLWRFSSTLSKLKDLHGHKNRVLHTAISPDGSTVCSASADETLCFWDVFGIPKKKESKPAPNRLGLNIR